VIPPAHLYQRLFNGRLLARTTAPAQYDGFGTVTLGHADAVTVWPPMPAHRLVLILPEHYEWQARRYISGMFAIGPVNFDQLSPAEKDT
jgi:hypothetical protein